MMHQTESALNKAKSNLEDAQHIAHLGSWEWDINDNKTNWSDEMYNIFGVSQKTFEASYDNFLLLVHPADRGLVARAVALSLRKHAPYDVEYRIMRPDGTERFIHAHADVRCDDQGQPLGMTGTSLDITKRKRLENELVEHRDHLQALVDERTEELVIAKDKAEAANKAKSVFLASVSHELKTPLNSIIGFSDVLTSGSAGPVTDEQKEYLDILHSSGHSLLSLVNNILELSSMGAGDVKLELNEFDLDMSMTNWIHGMEQEFADKNVSLSMEIESGIGTMTGDEQKLKRAVYHLLSNALKFTDSGGSTRLAVRSVKGDAGKGHGEDWVEISVKDTGIGISQDGQKKLFQPFVQLDDSLNRQHEGTGLGLMICQHIVELHDGQIRVESEPGKGSSFSFTIPRYCQAP
jgi:PAS domain S-box-containing protein